MLHENQIIRIIDKQKSFVTRMEDHMFDQVDTLLVSAYETYDRLDLAPEDDSLYVPAAPGFSWGDTKKYCWFRTAYTVPAALEGLDLYLWPEYEGYEGLLFVDGVPHTNYAGK